MHRISIELVPRDEAALIQEIELVRSSFDRVNTINIPDLTRFNLRSWEGCSMARRYFENAVPHLRAIDFDKDAPLPIAGFLDKHEIGEVLIVNGDPPKDTFRRVYASTSIDIIKKFKREMPHIRVYAAIDPYRCSFKDEHEYIRRKLDAGADGFFTQPFFDIRLMEVFAEWLGDVPTFWGVSPVTSENSQRYWETRNNVIFPQGFRPELDWNRDFACQALEFMRRVGGHIYFMPIKTDLRKYLEGIL